MKIILTCEHGGNNIPSKWKGYFNQRTLKSHRGWDPGALEIAKFLEKELKLPLFFGTQSRLLVELNRSLDNPNLFSPFLSSISETEKREIIEKYYLPYRQRVEKEMTLLINSGSPLLHLSVHTFTPVRQGITRDADIGILYDPKRKLEKKFAQEWKKELQEQGNYRIRLNYPYAGNSDGFTTFLRNQWSDSSYLGVELEVNQKFYRGSTMQWNKLMLRIANSLRGFGREDDGRTVMHRD